jgi:hypothetical protein
MGGGWVLACLINMYEYLRVYIRKKDAARKNIYHTYLWGSAYFSLSFPVIFFSICQGGVLDKLKSAEAILNERSSRLSVSLLTRQNKLFWLVHHFGTKLLIMARPQSDCGSTSMFLLLFLPLSETGQLLHCLFFN